MSRSLLDSAFTGASQKERSWSLPRLEIRPSCASPRGRPAADQEAGRAAGAFQGRGPVGGCAPPLVTSRSRSSEGGGQGAPSFRRQVQRPAALCLLGSGLGPHGCGHRSRRCCECPHLPCSPGARPAGGGRGCCWARGQRAALPAPAAARGRSPSPRRWCAPGSALRWEPPTEVSVPRATGAEERAATPRSPGRATGQLRLPGCAQRSPLKRGWRLPCAHAC